MALRLPQNFSLRHKLLLFAGVTVLAAWVAWFFVFQPQRLRLAELDGRYQNERRQVEMIEAHVLAHPDAARHMAELDARRKVVDLMLPEAPGVSEFLVAVEKAVRGSGTQLLQVKPSPPVNKNSYQETPLEIVVRGDFFQTVSFVKQLEDAQRFNAVTTLAMVAKPGGGLETKLQVVIYSMKR